MLKVCTVCGFTFSEIQARGMVGCAECYDVFASDLKSIFIPHFSKYSSKNSQIKTTIDEKEAVTKQDLKFAELSNLREQLSAAIFKERFEEARNLKVKISILENS